MSVLVVLMPTPLRTAQSDASGKDAGLSGGRSMSWRWALTDDGREVVRQGEDPPALWPRSDTLVAVLPPQTLSWARLDLPKVPAGRMRAALAGALEDRLLEDAEHLHFALPPQARPGRPATIAILAKAPLEAMLQAAEAAGQNIDRVVPLFEPCHPPRAHFRQADGDAADGAQLVWADEGGVAALPLEGDAARDQAQSGLDPQGLAPHEAGHEAPALAWTCTPAAAVRAEAWSGRPVSVVSEWQPAIQAAGSTWELRQFDLAPGHRGLRLGRELWRQFRSPAWRPVRLGLAAAVGVNVLGLQLWSWQQQQAVREAQQAQVALLKATHPQVRVVLDAPLQMQRELDRLRQAAGQPGEADLEAALSAAAAAWPAGLTPPQTLRFERGRLSLSAPGLDAAQVAAMGERLRPQGWAVAATGGALTLTRRSGAVTPGSRP